MTEPPPPAESEGPTGQTVAPAKEGWWRTRPVALAIVVLVAVGLAFALMASLSGGGSNYVGGVGSNPKGLGYYLECLGLDREHGVGRLGCR